jgi:hypothetical protein
MLMVGWELWNSGSNPFGLDGQPTTTVCPDGASASISSDVAASGAAGSAVGVAGTQAANTPPTIEAPVKNRNCRLDNRTTFRSFWELTC